jgi:hypothetical protein
MAEEPGAGHFEDAADLGRLATVEEKIGIRSVGVSGAGSGEEAESDKGVEEIAGGTGWRPRCAERESNSCGPCASSVKTPIPTALSRVLEAQKARPVWRIWSGVRVGCAVTGALVSLNQRSDKHTDVKK